MLKSIKGNELAFYTFYTDIYLLQNIVRESQTSPSKHVFHDPLKNDKHLDIDNSRLDSTGENFIDHSENWRHYITKTGRLAGYLSKTRNFTSPSESERKEIWKPAFSLNTTSSINTNYPSLNQSATYEISSHGLNKKSKVRIMDDSKTSQSVKGLLLIMMFNICQVMVLL